MNYSITIDIYRKARYKVYSYQLGNENLKVISFSLNKPDKVITEIKLSTSVKQEFDEYLSKFPLSELKEAYRNDNVRGNHHVVFDITINSESKQINVYFEKQKDIVELYNKVLSLVPHEEKFYYFK